MDDQIAELMTLFMKRRLVRKTDRKYKKPKPGKKRLVKFPRTIVPHPVRACHCSTLRSHHRAPHWHSYPASHDVDHTTTELHSSTAKAPHACRPHELHACTTSASACPFHTLATPPRRPHLYP